ncbi:hypothetical protein A9Q81_06810 [Gammaproteobacteria bacterium 42_54_T18]|nr:hypothetical protein A9Q81_06810 [Gammaproteobacteria bacterium 42_54_T18]
MDAGRMTLRLTLVLIFVLTTSIYGCTTVPHSSVCETEFENNCIEKKKKKNTEDDMERLDHKNESNKII